MKIQYFVNIWRQFVENLKDPAWVYRHTEDTPEDLPEPRREVAPGSHISSLSLALHGIGIIGEEI